MSLLDALFTATSATCVTGLTVVDTGSRFSAFGQAVVLGLIQLGGLGIMTFAVFTGIALGGRVAFRAARRSRDPCSTPRARRAPAAALRGGLHAGSEAAGAVVLWLRFAPGAPAGAAVWSAVFHSVSAFCNAGFSLFPDNLVRYRGDLLVNVGITGLVILGGLGFLASLELRDQLVARLRRVRPPQPTLHTRLVLLATARSCWAATLVYLVLEWGNVLRGLPVAERLLAAWFLSVTPRTAGFNTVDYGQLSSETLFFTIFLMFVGAAPGSTGGGIKITTFGLLVALVDRALARPRACQPVPPYHPAPRDGSRAAARGPCLGSRLARDRVAGDGGDGRRALRSSQPALPRADVRGGLGVRHRWTIDRHHAAARRRAASWC